jgi:hypothetical protein
MDQKIKEYLDANGANCVNCGSTKIGHLCTASLMDGRIDQVEQQMRCYSCKTDWRAIYTISGAYRIKLPEQTSEQIKEERDNLKSRNAELLAENEKLTKLYEIGDR